MITDNVLPFNLLSHQEVLLALAAKVRQRRLTNEWTRQDLANYSNVTVSSIKRFELEGKISLDKLIAIAFALNAVDEFLLLFPEKRIASIRDLEQGRSERKRGKRKNAGQ